MAGRSRIDAPTPSRSSNFFRHRWEPVCKIDEGIRLETSAFEFFYGGQFTLSTQLIKPNYLRYARVWFLCLISLKITVLFRECEQQLSSIIDPRHRSYFHVILP